MPLHFKGLTDVHGLSDGEYLLLVNIVDILRNGDLYRNTDIRPAYTYASLIRQVRYKLFMIFYLICIAVLSFGGIFCDTLYLWYDIRAIEIIC